VDIGEPKATGDPSHKLESSRYHMAIDQTTKILIILQAGRSPTRGRPGPCICRIIPPGRPARGKLPEIVTEFPMCSGVIPPTTVTVDVPLLLSATATMSPSLKSGLPPSHASTPSERSIAGFSTLLVP
jgi:hypothetical protein